MVLDVCSTNHCWIELHGEIYGFGLMSCSQNLGNLATFWGYDILCAVFFRGKTWEICLRKKKKLLSGLITRGERVKSLNISLWYGPLIHFYGFLFFLLEMLLPVFGTGFGRLFYMACGISFPSSFVVALKSSFDLSECVF